MDTARQAVELFHLVFLSHLEKKLDKNLYALKGGCNLRFFFKSIRYSEDIDLDVQTIAKDTLQNKIDKVLDNPILRQNFKSKGLEILQVSKPKQTETTQRWKLSLKADGLAVPLPTKIEFSRRKMDEAAIFEPVDPGIIRQYALYPIIVNHYVLKSAFEQKILALAHRTETQARDIFDLKLLIEQGVTLKNISQETKVELGKAIENTMNIRFADFKAQVVAFLMSDYQSYYDSEKVWDALQQEVLACLEKGVNP